MLPNAMVGMEDSKVEKDVELILRWKGILYPSAD